jgi:hypothetical protein
VEAEIAAYIEVETAKLRAKWSRMDELRHRGAREDEGQVETVIVSMGIARRNNGHAEY